MPKSTPETRRAAAAPLTVVKVGGGLSQEPGALDRVAMALARAGRRHRLLVVPGGGPFADTVRSFARGEPLSDDAAHWMAILAMDQYAHVLAERIAGATLVEDASGIGPALSGPGVAVLAPSRWMRAADVLPHRWEATSDSVSAFVAGALDAALLVLIKPAAALASDHGIVDECFGEVLPAGLRWVVLGADRVGELEALLPA